MPSLDIDGQLVDALIHTGAQFLVGQGDTEITSTIEQLRSRAEACVGILSAPEKQVLLSKLRIQELLSQKDMQREVRRSDTETAKILLAVSEENRQFLERLTAQEAQDIAVETRSAIDAIMAAETDGSVQAIAPVSEEALYEQVLGVSFDEVKVAAEKQNAKKWIDLIGPVFLQGKALSVLAETGCIPHQLYTAKSFKQTVHFPHLATLHEELKQAEEQSDGVERGRILHARAQLLAQLLQQNVAEKAGGDVTLDVNGLFINLDQRTGKERGSGEDKVYSIHAHLPYSYVTDDLLSAMQAQGRLTEADALECRYRSAEDANDPVSMERIEQEKIKQMMALLDIAHEGDVITAEHKRELIKDALVFTGYFRRKRNESKQIQHFPLSLINFYLHKEKLDVDPVYKVRNILEVAEDMQQDIAKERSFLQGEGYASYSLARSAQDSYALRKKNTHNPRNYDAARITGEVLENLEALASSDIVFTLFRGTVEDEEGGLGQSFVEIAEEHGGVQRVLIDPDKQLTTRQKEIFLQLPEFSRQDHELFEALAFTYRFYRRHIPNLREMNGARGFDLPGNRQQEILEEITAETNMFLLMEDPEHYAEAMDLYADFITQSPHSMLPYDYLRIYENAVKAFADKLFKGDIQQNLEKFRATIQRREVDFGNNFLDDLPERFKPNAYKTWDQDLCNELAEIEQKINVVDAGDREIPYAMETKAVRALHLLPDRPLITVIGGCRDLPLNNGQGNGVDTLCAHLVKAAHTLKANVCVPGTQSGIGTILGRASVAYQQQTADLTAAQKARFFAVSPGGETYYPGNPHLAPESEKEAMAFAIGPFDSILTPFQAGWDWKGQRLREAPYFRHVEYASAITRRVSSGQPRVTVVGNGGLFTVVEAIADLKNNSSMILVRDTGRFADLAIQLSEHRSEIDSAFEKEKSRPHEDRQKFFAANESGEILSYYEMKEEKERVFWMNSVENIIEKYVPAHSRDALFTAFGRGDSVTPEQQLYREKIQEYYALSAKADIHVTTVDGVEQEVLNTVERLKNTKDR